MAGILKIEKPTQPQLAQHDASILGNFVYERICVNLLPYVFSFFSFVC